MSSKPATLEAPAAVAIPRPLAAEDHPKLTTAAGSMPTDRPAFEYFGNPTCECGTGFISVGDRIVCRNPQCRHFGVRFAVPKIPLEKL